MRSMATSLISYTCPENLSRCYGCLGISTLPNINEQADTLAKSAGELEKEWNLPRDLQTCLSLGKLSEYIMWPSHQTNLQLPTIKPALEKWVTSGRPSRREEVALARRRVGSTLLRHLRPYVNRTLLHAAPHIIKRSLSVTSFCTAESTRKLAGLSQTTARGWACPQSSPPFLGTVIRTWPIG